MGPFLRPRALAVIAVLVLSLPAALAQDARPLTVTAEDREAVYAIEDARASASGDVAALRADAAAAYRAAQADAFAAFEAARAHAAAAFQAAAEDAAASCRAARGTDDAARACAEARDAFEAARESAQAAVREARYAYHLELEAARASILHAYRAAVAALSAEYEARVTASREALEARGVREADVRRALVESGEARERVQEAAPALAVRPAAADACRDGTTALDADACARVERVAATAAVSVAENAVAACRHFAALVEAGARAADAAVRVGDRALDAASCARVLDAAGTTATTDATRLTDAHARACHEFMQRTRAAAADGVDAPRAPVVDGVTLSYALCARLLAATAETTPVREEVADRASLTVTDSRATLQDACRALLAGTEARAHVDALDVTLTRDRCESLLGVAPTRTVTSTTDALTQACRELLASRDAYTTVPGLTDRVSRERCESFLGTGGVTDARTTDDRVTDATRDATDALTEACRTLLASRDAEIRVSGFTDPVSRERCEAVLGGATATRDALTITDATITLLDRDTLLERACERLEASGETALTLEGHRFTRDDCPRDAETTEVRG